MKGTVLSAEGVCAAIAAPVLLVLGGFHALSVAQANGAAPQLPATLELSEHGAALIPFSNERLDRLNSYAAGMAAPEWQNKLFAAFSGKKTPSARQLGQIRAQLTLTLLTQLADGLREHWSLSMPTLQAAFEQQFSRIRLSELIHCNAHRQSSSASHLPYAVVVKNDTVTEMTDTPRG